MNNIDFEIVGSFIKNLREENNLTQMQLANILNVSKPAISQWESGNEISLENIYNISKFFSISIEELLLGKRKDEIIEEHIKKYYDISKYLQNDYLSDNEAKDFYSRVKRIKDKYFELLIKWANNTLNDDENKLFKAIKIHFELDTKYYSYLTNNTNSTINCQKSLIKSLKEKYNDEEYLFEVTKLYNFNGLLILFNSSKQFEYFLNSLSQREKDESFTNSLLDESNASAKMLINNNANYLINYTYNKNVIDSNILSLIEGKIKKLGKNNAVLVKRCIDDDSNKINTKYYTFDEYKSAIDPIKTKYYKLLFNEKYNDSIKYYTGLVKLYEME